MSKAPFSGHFLRRKDARRRINCDAVIERRDVSRKIEIVDFSNTGLRIDKLTGLATGDRVTIVLTPHLSIEGTIAWLVWHKAGVRLSSPLRETDPVYRYLTDRAAELEQSHVRAIAALAQQHTIKAKSPDTN
jgi:hypothetical protein